MDVKRPLTLVMRTRNAMTRQKDMNAHVSPAMKEMVSPVHLSPVLKTPMARQDVSVTLAL